MTSKIMFLENKLKNEQAADKPIFSNRFNINQTSGRLND